MGRFAGTIPGLLIGLLSSVIFQPLSYSQIVGRLDPADHRGQVQYHPKTDPGIVINELNYSADLSEPVIPEVGFEFVELFNRSESTVTLDSWLLTDESNATLYSFPVGGSALEMPAGSFLAIYSSAAAGILSPDVDLSDGSGRVIAIDWAENDLVNSGDSIQLYGTPEKLPGVILDEERPLIDFVSYDRDDAEDDSAIDNTAVTSGIWCDGAAVPSLAVGYAGRSLYLVEDGQAPHEADCDPPDQEDLDWSQYPDDIGGSPGASNASVLPAPTSTPTRIPTCTPRAAGTGSPTIAASPTPTPAVTRSPTPTAAVTIPVDLMINEILFNPTGQDAGREFIELHNNSASSLILTGMVLRWNDNGEYFQFPGFALGSEDYVTVHTNATGENTQTDLYPAAALPNMGNSWGSVSLWLTSNPPPAYLIDFVQYGSAGQAWEEEANAANMWETGEYFDISDFSEGSSMGRHPDGQDTDSPADWIEYWIATQGAGNEILPTPTRTVTPTGTATPTLTSTPQNPPTPQPYNDYSLIINEFMADPEEAEPENEWIELRNVSGEEVSLSGWKVGAGEFPEGDYAAFTFPAGSHIDAWGYIVLGGSAQAAGWRVDYIYNTVPETQGTIRLVNDEGTIFLSRPDNEVVDHVSYNSSWRIATGKSMARKSVARSTDFIELYNAGSASIDMAGFCLTKGYMPSSIVPYASPSTALAPHSYALIIGSLFPLESYPELPPQTLVLTVDNTELSGGVNEEDQLYLLLPGGSVSDSFATYSGTAPSEGQSIEKLDYEMGDTAENWTLNSSSGATPGADNSVSKRRAPRGQNTEDPSVITEVLARGAWVRFSDDRYNWAKNIGESGSSPGEPNQVDTLPPLIFHAPLTDALIHHDIYIHCRIKDESYLYSAVNPMLHYRKAASPPSEFTGVKMSALNDTYYGKIPRELVDTAGEGQIEYYITTEDASANEASAPVILPALHPYPVNIHSETDGDKLQITEIMYDPPCPIDPQDPRVYPPCTLDEYGDEWAEFSNFGEEPILLDGYQFTNITGVFNFPAGITVDPGQHMVLCNNLAAFRDVYPAVSLESLIEYGDDVDVKIRLPNSFAGVTGAIALKNAAGVVVHEVDYSSAWGAQNGGGPNRNSLEKVDLDGPDDGTNWMFSTGDDGGTPAMPSSPHFIFTQYEDQAMKSLVTRQGISLNRTLIHHEDPARNSVTISYRLDRPCYVTVKIYNPPSPVSLPTDCFAAGYLVRTLVDHESRSANYLSGTVTKDPAHEEVWDGLDDGDSPVYGACRILVQAEDPVSQRTCTCRTDDTVPSSYWDSYDPENFHGFGHQMVTVNYRLSKPMLFYLGFNYRAASKSPADITLLDGDLCPRAEGQPGDILVNSYLWDVADTNGNYVPSSAGLSISHKALHGIYGNVVILRDKALEITSMNLSPTGFFDPRSEEPELAELSINYQVSVACTAAISVIDDRGNPVKELAADSGLEPGPHSVESGFHASTWDGTDSSETLVADGHYVIVARVASDLGDSHRMIRETVVSDFDHPAWIDPLSTPPPSSTATPIPTMTPIPTATLNREISHAAL